MTRVITIGLIYVVTIVAIVWDIIALADPSPGDTISQIALETFTKHPVMAFIVGGMLGHFSSNMLDYLPSWWLWMSIPLLFILVVAVLVLDFGGQLRALGGPPIWYVLVGMFVTYFLWPQRWYGF